MARWPGPWVPAQRDPSRWSRVDNPRAFCRRVMHNIVIDQGRVKQRQVPEIRLAEGHDDGDPRSADSAEAVELRPALFSALRTLTPHQREIVVLRYFDDRSENEVAELLGVAPGTVRSTLSRAVTQLREQPGLSALFAPPEDTGLPGGPYPPRLTPAASNTMTRKVRYA